MTVILAVALSLDAFGMGISCGLRRQRLGFFTYAILFAISAAIMAASTLFGDFISSFLSPDVAEYIAAFWIMALGIWIALGAIIKKGTDGNAPKKITKKGAVQLALVLSIDSIGAGLAAASLGISIIALPLLVATFQIGFLALGAQIPTWLRLKAAHQNRWTVVAGMILIFMGVIQLL
ncbi:MAG: manganese efflux pump [Defluviitaleaceae bacterium]|nr:manganese efflux pump [Defluviitaleaceae bacterium]